MPVATRSRAASTSQPGPAPKAQPAPPAPAASSADKAEPAQGLSGTSDSTPNSRESSPALPTATSTAVTTPSASSAEFSPKSEPSGLGLSLPATQPALLAALPSGEGSAWSLREEHPVPTPGEGEVLVRTNYVGLNPFDWQAVDFKFGVGKEPKVVGRDGSGVVVQVGEGVDRFKVGDRVWFCANGARPSAAAFQSYSVHAAAEVGLTPTNLSDIEAATVPTGVVTAGVALFRTLELELALLSQTKAEVTGDEKPWLLVWGGAGSTGVFLIQLAKLAGFRIICAASPVNEEYVKGLGADVVLDRWQSEEQLVDQIRAATEDNVLLAVDNVGPKTAALCAQVVAGSAAWRKAHNILTSSDAPSSARLLAIAGSPKTPASSPDAAADAPSDALRTVEQPRLSFSTTFYGHHAFSAPFLDAVSAALAAGDIKPGRSRVIDGGLWGIEAGLQELKSGSGQGGFKLVARLGEKETDAPVVEEVAVPEEEGVRTKRGLEEAEAATEEGAAKKRKTEAIAELVTEAEVDAVTYRM